MKIYRISQDVVNDSGEEFDSIANDLPEDKHDGKLYGYHVTSRHKLESIKAGGLIPQIPEDYGEDGDARGVYLFKTLDDTTNALMNWLGERIEEMEEETNTIYNEVCLKVDLTGLEAYLASPVEFEWVCLITITPDRIVEIYDPI